MSHKALSVKSRIGDVLKHPLGRDMLYRLSLQTGMRFSLVDNPLVRQMRLSLLPTLSGGKVDRSLLDSFLTLLNSEKARPLPEDGEYRPAWWKEAVIYQIYPASFKDSNADGIGDLAGIIEKLDYLQELGVDCIWLSPIFESPFDDNGYDISNYLKIADRFGDLETFDRLIDEAHKRHIRVLLDLVINHTSDEHPWFQEALEDPSSAKRAYYYFEEGDAESAPNNWTSFFSGSAWRYFPEQKVWALHLFSPKQMDLNWDNKEVRDAVAHIAKFWLERKVDGFRLDVINYISKVDGLPDGNKAIGDLIGFSGIEHYVFGPKLHHYLNELNERAFEPYEAVSIGETPGVGREMGKLLTDPDRKELSLVMSFDHLETPGHERFDDYRYDLDWYKHYRIAQKGHVGGRYWQTLFFDNHDNPRMVGKVDPDERYREPLAKLINGLILTGLGTPILYQGQELGMPNVTFTSIDEMRDVEALNLHAELIGNALSEEEAFRHVLAGARDHARVPVTWTSEKYHGFSNVEPWIWPENPPVCQPAEEQIEDRSSVFSFPRQLLHLRKEYAALINGGEAWIKPRRRGYFGLRRAGDPAVFIEANLTAKEMKRPYQSRGTFILGNYGEVEKSFRPYEINLYIET